MSIKRYIQALVAVALVAAVAVSCHKQVERIPVLTLQMPTIGNAGGSQFMEVASDTDWSLKVNYDIGTDWIRINRTSGPAGIMNVVVKIEPNEGATIRSAEIVLTTAGRTAVKKVKQAAQMSGNLPIWLELPSIESTDKVMVFGIHDMEGGEYKDKSTSGMRNYSFYWDVEGLVSIWVAYPLNRDLYGTKNYDYEWRLDPILEKMGVYQPDITQHSYGGYPDWDNTPWNRGHQMARADRQLTQASVMSTCYPTNITPQAGVFNGGVWGSLEGAVRSAAGRLDPKKDTLYVVSGCTQDGSDTWTSSWYQRSVKVPSAYFKALLRKQGTSYQAVGFFLPHTAETAASESYKNYICTIASLEQRLGYKLFNNLSLATDLDDAAITALKNPADPQTLFNAW